MKLNKHAWVIWGIALITVIALMILIPFARTATWWIAAIGTILMFGVCAFTFYKAFNKDKTLESKLLGWPIFKVGSVTLFAQIIVGAILMGTANFCPTNIAIIAEVIVYAVTGISLTIKEASREVVTSFESKVEDKTDNWKAIRAKANAIAATANNAAIKKLAEAIRFADPAPTSLDGSIEQALANLSENPTNENIEAVNQLLNQRKTISKAEK